MGEHIRINRRGSRLATRYPPLPHLLPNGCLSCSCIMLTSWYADSMQSAARPHVIPRSPWLKTGHSISNRSPRSPCRAKRSPPLCRLVKCPPPPLDISLARCPEQRLNFSQTYGIANATMKIVNWIGELLTGVERGGLERTKLEEELQRRGSRSEDCSSVCSVA